MPGSGRGAGDSKVRVAQAESESEGRGRNRDLLLDPALAVEMRLAFMRGSAARMVERVREIDPTWMGPTAVSTGAGTVSPEQEIAYYESVLAAGEARLREIANSGLGNNSGESIDPAGNSTGGGPRPPRIPGYNRDLSFEQPVVGLPDFLLRKPGQGRLSGSSEALARLTSEERGFVDEMVMLGNKVEVIDTGTERTPDLRLNGKEYERKRLGAVEDESSNGISSAISNRVMNARGQAVDIIIDARQQNGMTSAIAERGIARAYGQDRRTGSKIESITVLTPQGPVYSPRRK